MKAWLSKILAGAAAEAGAEATRRGLQKLDESPEEALKREQRAKRRRAWLLLGGGAIGLVLVIGLMSAVLEWILLAGFAAAAGYGGWLLLRPKVRQLTAARSERRAALAAKEAEAEAAREAEAAVREAAAAREAKQQALEDELAALKARSGRED
ncbi:MAG: hypothetical protein P1V51_11610 [Deltaproteobacteria bacterium]|nr:hypothetical protein [Deltaproteobacteria bacterium]